MSVKGDISMRFSSLSHGSKIVLSEDGLEAHKRGPYYYEGTGVYIATPLRGTCEIELEVIDTESHDEGNHGPLVIGIGQSLKGSHKHIDLPHKIGRDSTGLCYWCQNTVFNCLIGNGQVDDASLHGGHGNSLLRQPISYQHLTLTQGDTAGLRLNENGDLSFTINQKDQGIVATNVYREDYDIYPVFSLNDCVRTVRITKALMSNCYGEPGQLKEPKNKISVNVVDFGFHSETGARIVLFEEGRYARRVNPSSFATVSPFWRHVVYGAVPTDHRSTCVFEIEIAENDDVRIHKEGIGFGVLRAPTGRELKWSDLPKQFSPAHCSCVWFESEVCNMLASARCEHQYGLIGLNTLQEGDRVGLQLSSNRDLSFFVNGVTQGVAARGVLKEGYNVYPLVCIQGNCNAVRITRAEVNCEVPALQELCVMKIISYIGRRLRDVRQLPLPRGLVKQMQQQIQVGDQSSVHCPD